MPIDSNIIYMSTKQVAEYLDLNEKKVYSMANHRILPATKVTGKWLFPKVLIDRWLMDSCHSGMLSDRMHITGSDDPLLSMLVAQLMSEGDHQEIISYSSTGSKSGLELLSRGYADVCSIHWESQQGNRDSLFKLLKSYPNHQQWILVSGYERHQGLMVRKEMASLFDSNIAVPEQPLRWVSRQKGAGSQRHLEHWLTQQNVNIETLLYTATAQSERELAGYIARENADIGFGCQAVAAESGLHFIPKLTESFDFVMSQSIFFRRQLQALLGLLNQPQTAQLANLLSGYQLNKSGELLWRGQ
ncbi:helix-turn-helix transcriptional regulator [Shewanella electrodiphila]|uniref:Helix-turn-helix transcriptional regulator n=1 Tax=Shewanella electrodiphila TaxID=934143 RepID=A0ABT0KKP8_9GAMM|nr:helix-turn-helix transcriptional regulator [Shewanella electrodiphila]MCL1044407.1 helix-turn-helix transcriptional regulator [Shewanella electrodiphila]